MDLEDCNFNKNDFDILEILIGNECKTPFKSLTIKYLIKESKFSHLKVRQTMKTFQIYGLVKDGAKDGNNKTYYVTQKGIDYYCSIMDYNEIDLEDLVNSYLNKEEE